MKMRDNDGGMECGGAGGGRRIDPIPFCSSPCALFTLSWIAPVSP